MIPAPIIERHGNFNILRDDLLDGGTKRRALLEWLPSLNATHFTYAGTVFGSGAWALLESCRDLGYGCKILMARNDYIPDWAEKFSANIEWHDPAPVADLHARAQKENAYVLPLGFNDPAFSQSLIKNFKSIEIKPSEIWLPVVSGTLALAARSAWRDIPIHVVCAARHHNDLGDIKTYYAPEKYHQAAKNPPPYPAHKFTDAKLWQFVEKYAREDALIWNTSR